MRHPKTPLFCVSFVSFPEQNTPTKTGRREAPKRPEFLPKNSVLDRGTQPTHETRELASGFALKNNQLFNNNSAKIT